MEITMAITKIKSPWLLATLMMSTVIQAQGTETDQRSLIESTLNDYIQGTSYNDKNRILQAFSSDAKLLLEKQGQALWPVPVEQYATWFDKQNKGKFNGRIGEILAIDVEGKVATAKVEILMPNRSERYLDMFLLKKLDGKWKIISKTAAGDKANHSGERILFIVSNAHFHGDSKLAAGVSFSEIVKAFDTFKQAGFTVDFVSSQGGAIPLSYINTSVPIHKKYLYNSDFMYAIGNTKSPSEITPSHYRAVHYVGGSNAMYQVAEDPRLQQITMEIYEQHGGIISSVCHGTAGIVNLKTKEGDYVYAGKRISGYPEAYENQSKAYFKQFPFHIQKTIEERGGEFYYSDRNTPHVEVDGRIVTGQNHLSSALVAEKMVALLKQGES